MDREETEAKMDGNSCGHTWKRDEIRDHFQYIRHALSVQTCSFNATLLGLTIVGLLESFSRRSMIAEISFFLSAISLSLTLTTSMSAFQNALNSASFSFENRAIPWLNRACLVAIVVGMVALILTVTPL